MGSAVEQAIGTALIYIVLAMEIQVSQFSGLASDLNAKHMIGATVPTVLFGTTRRSLGLLTNQMSMKLSVHCLNALQQG